MMNINKSMLLAALLASNTAIAQNSDSTFYSNNLPQSLRLIAKSDKYDAYLDQQRKIINPDGSVTAEAILEYYEAMEDGTKSRALVYTYYCNEKDEKKSSYIEFSNYSGSKKTGSYLKGGKISFSKDVIKQKTITESLFNAVCVTPATQTSQAPSSSGNQKSFKIVPRLTPEEINNSVIKKGMSQTDLDIFLTMYGFIWSLNNFLNDTPDPSSTRWIGGEIQQHQKLAPYKSNAQLALNKFESTISTLAGNAGLSNAQFKQAIGIIEVFTPAACDRCSRGYKTLKSKKGGLVSEVLNREDITSDGISDGIRAFYDYKSTPGSSSAKNDKGHPGFELNPPAFFDFYTKWIPAYYLDSSRLSKFNAAAVSTEERIEKQYLDAELAKAKRQDDERKRQEFLNSPEGKRQVAKEQEQERLREKQFAKDFPFYAVITCGEHFPVHACFSGRVTTELELRNGSDYKMYTLTDIMQIPQNQNGLSFNLRNKFELKMQNSDGSLILNLKIYNRVTDSIVYEKSAAKYGVIRISN